MIQLIGFWVKLKLCGLVQENAVSLSSDWLVSFYHDRVLSEVIPTYGGRYLRLRALQSSRLGTLC